MYLINKGKNKTKPYSLNSFGITYEDFLQFLYDISHDAITNHIIKIVSLLSMINELNDIIIFDANNTIMFDNNELLNGASYKSIRLLKYAI